MVGGTTDTDLFLSGQLSATEDRQGRNAQFVLERKCEAAPQEQLPAIGAGHLSGRTAELEPHQPEPAARLAARRLKLCYVFPSCYAFQGGCYAIARYRPSRPVRSSPAGASYFFAFPVSIWMWPA